MNQQPMMNQQGQKTMAVLQDQDIVYSYLADLKRTAREYTTAVTESNCPVVRQNFEQLLQSTLQMQGQVYQLMSKQGWYNTSSSVQAQEIQKQMTQYQQTQQQTSQLVKSYLH